MKPGWQGLRGHQRVAAECKQLGRDIAAGKLPQLWDLEPHNDAASIWRVKLSHFDEDLPGGTQINRDLQQLAHQYGRQYGHILLEVSFPHDYPTRPMFLRVVRPRMVMYTGHVTAGGSICIEALSLTGSPSGWQPSYCLESILQLAMANMVDTPVVRVHTTTGPGGMSGPLRVDFKYPPWQEYSYHEARDAFQRTEEHHRRTGWGGPARAPRPPGTAGRTHGWGGGGGGGGSGMGRSLGGDGGLVGLMAAFGSSHQPSGTGGEGSSAPPQRPPPAAPKPPPKRPVVPSAPTPPPPAAPKPPARRPPALPAASRPATSRSHTRTSADRPMPPNPSKASGSKPPAKLQASPREMAAAAAAARAAAAAKDANCSAQAEASAGGKQRRREEPAKEQPADGAKRPRLEGTGGAGPRSAATQGRVGHLGQARAGASQPPARPPAPAAVGSRDVIDLTDDAPTSRAGAGPVQRGTPQRAAAAGAAPIIDLTRSSMAPKGSGGSRRKAPAPAQAEVVDLT